MRIEMSENFQNDLKRYKSALEQTESKEVKTKLNNLIQNLIKEVRSIDTQHIDLNVTKTLSTNIHDSRQNIFTIRENIEKSIKSL
jgi:uncharacterized membrane protein YgaE (UPF0421/DUF939 family)